MTAVVMLERASLLLLRTKYCRHPSVDAVTTVIPLIAMIAGFRLLEQTLLKPRTLARMLLLLLLLDRCPNAAAAAGDPCSNAAAAGDP